MSETNQNPTGTNEAPVTPAPTPQPAPVANTQPAPAPTPVAAAPADELALGIGSDVKSSNLVPFQPSAEAPITLGFLFEVKPEIRKMKETQKERDVLTFHFIDEKNRRHHFHTEWDLDNGDKDFKVKLDGLNRRIKHLYETFAVFPEAGIGKGAKTFKELFAAIATAFNNNGAGVPIYSKIPIWIKVTYNLKGGAKSTLGFPLSPNFVERFTAGIGTTLYINNKYETIEQPKRPTVANPLGGGGAPLGGLPTAIPGEFPKFPG